MESRNILIFQHGQSQISRIFCEKCTRKSFYAQVGNQRMSEFPEKSNIRKVPHLLSFAPVIKLCDAFSEELFSVKNSVSVFHLF